MTESLLVQIEKLKQSMAAIEAQRELLGDSVEPALESMSEKLSSLEAQAAAEAQPALEEERRVITILFSDVVGSTSLAETLDPEEWRIVIARLHETAGEIIVRHQGQVVQYLGDGLLAFFGAQRPSEYDPENAIRAALEFRGSVGETVGPLPGTDREKLELRIGVHTGLVVVGDLGDDFHREFTGTGDAMNLAARLQSAAPPGGVLISHDTYRHVRGLFDFTPQPPLSVKGKREPIQTYLMRRVRPRPFRAVTRGVAGIETRTVGRQEEMKRIQAAYLEATAEHKVAWVQLIGDPGVGKSRLVEDTREWLDLRQERMRLLKARAYEGEANQPFALVRRMWFDHFQIAEDAPLAQAEAKWVREFQELMDSNDEEPAHALGLLLGLSFRDSPHIEGMRDDPAQIKGRAFVVSRELLVVMLRHSPLEILLEDLHNADVSSLEYLTDVILDSRNKENGVFVLATARSQWEPPAVFKALWQEQHESQVSLAVGIKRQSIDQSFASYAPLPKGISVVKIDLAPLSDKATRELANELLRYVEGVPEEALNLIVERAEGVPYYAEEMMNWFLDRGIIDRSQEPWLFLPERLRGTPLPTTLQHLLLTRLSVLTERERLCLQYGSVFGRNFWTGGVETLGSPDNSEALDELRMQGFIDLLAESTFEGEQEWSFRQNLLRETTYDSILKRERIRLHKLVGEWLESQAKEAGRLDEFAGLLGEHTERAGELSLAADWYLQAGERATAQGGRSEAFYYFDRALELLPPVDRERRWQALLGRVDAQFEVDARRMDITALIELAQEYEDQERLAKAMYRKAHHLLWSGDYRESLSTLEETLDIVRRTGDQNVEVLVLANMAHAHTFLGNLTAAGEIAGSALTAAEQMRDDELLAAIVLPLYIFYGYHQGDAEMPHYLANKLVTISQRQGNRHNEALGLNLLGSNYTALGLYKDAREALRKAYQLAEVVGARLTRTHAIKQLGHIHWRLGDTLSAREMLEEAIVEFSIYGDVETSGQCYFFLALLMESLEDHSGAARRYAQVREICIELGIDSIFYEAVAGMARCTLGQGQLDQASQNVGEVWQYILESGTRGMYFPILAYHTCAEIFDALAESEKSRAALEAGHTELMESANRINNLQWRQSFLRNVPEHRHIVALWERMDG